MRNVLVLAVGVVLGSWSGAAAAEPRHVVITLPLIPVKGRVQIPLAAVEVNRAEPKLTLTELRPSFTDHIAQTIGRDPY